jgi:hypothetical protein
VNAARIALQILSREILSRRERERLALASRLYRSIRRIIRGKTGKTAGGEGQAARSIRARREALKTIPELIAEAQESFNAYIRLRDRDKGCFVCRRPFIQDVKGRAIHAGHARSRGAAGHLRFTEDNCFGECEGCNAPYGAKPHQKAAGAISRIGAQRWAEIEADNTPHKWTREELISIRDTYRKKTKELKAKHEQA